MWLSFVLYLLIFNPILPFGRGSFQCLFHIHSNFLLIPPCSLSDIGGNSWFLYYAKSIVQFSPRLGWAPYLYFFLLDRLLTTKRHSSDVYPSYIPNFSMFIEALSYAYSTFIAIFNSFLLVVYVVAISEAKSIAQFLPRLGWALIFFSYSINF